MQLSFSWWYCIKCAEDSVWSIWFIVPCYQWASSIWLWIVLAGDGCDFSLCTSQGIWLVPLMKPKDFLLVWQWMHWISWNTFVKTKVNRIAIQTLLLTWIWPWSSSSFTQRKHWNRKEWKQSTFIHQQTACNEPLWLYLCAQITQSCL